jgi:hypothetical protein
MGPILPCVAAAGNCHFLQVNFEFSSELRIEKSRLGKRRDFLNCTAMKLLPAASRAAFSSDIRDGSIGPQFLY